ncbi:MAG: SMP-30/gluconolactonase/LRE family protein [Leptospiraceae bacterium]|nr:SMP-30/gluconolactonase/LRE family protein [Leptospiraceae bacterium]
MKLTLVIILNGLFSILFFLNCLAQVKPVPISGCTKIFGPIGPEDFALDDETNVLFVSSHDRKNFDSIGSIYSMKLTDKIPKLVKLEIEYPKNFRPHGVSIAKTNQGKKFYVISHRREENIPHSVEVFKIEKETLVHEKTIQDKSFTNPNDLFVFSDGRILVSNDNGTSIQFLQFLNLAFLRKTARLTLYKDGKWKELEPAHVLGNGVHVLLQDNKEIVYLADTYTGKIFVYELKNDSLEFLRKIELDSGPDNFTVDENGDLIVAAHKSLFRFLKHQGNKDSFSPSQIFKIKKDYSFEEIYANSGEEISASSTGLIYKNNLYITQVFEPFLLSCPLVK